MAAFLAGKGTRTWIASLGGTFAERLPEGVHHIAMPVGRKAPHAIVANAIRIGRLIDREGIEIVHARSRVPSWVGWLAATRFSRRKPPFVATVHGLYSSGSALKRWYNSAQWRGALTIANSDNVRRHLIETYRIAPERVIVAYRGIDEGEFDPSRFDAETVAGVRREFGIPGHSPILLMVARLTRWKGQDVLLRALGELKDLDWRVLAVGEPEGESGFAGELRALVETNGIADRVTFTGGRDDVARLNFAADLAFSCSVRPEAFGRVAIEAGAMGTPVVATAHGGSLETVVDGVTGWLVPPGDSAALAATIRRLLADPVALATAGAAARRHVHANFTARQTCEVELAVYRRLLGRDAPA
jgi:glycosyltransferase involved in cell wall biosynthesis